jgi:predicted transcriptional regulator of viral defense system
MGNTIERTSEIVRRMGLARYRGIIRQGGHRWGIENGAALPVTFCRLESGLYALTDRHFSATTQASLKARKGVVCLLSALWIHGVLEREPDKVHIAIGERARRPRWQHPAAVFYRMTQRLLTADTRVVYVDSFPVSVFSLARTILDCHRFRRSIGADVAERALDAALERNLLAPYPFWRLAQGTRAKGWAGATLMKRGHLSARDLRPRKRPG